MVRVGQGPKSTSVSVSVLLCVVLQCTEYGLRFIMMVVCELLSVCAMICFQPERLTIEAILLFSCPCVVHDEDLLLESLTSTVYFRHHPFMRTWLTIQEHSVPIRLSARKLVRARYAFSSAGFNTSIKHRTSTIIHAHCRTSSTVQYRTWHRDSAAVQAHRSSQCPLVPLRPDCLSLLPSLFIV